jgi:anti-anti-sigma regulatory factor
MLLDLASEWTIDLERGPDWLFIRLRPPVREAGARKRGGEVREFPLADKIFEKIEPSFCYRVVVELDDVRLKSWMLGELVRLQKRIDEHGGTLRICGLSTQGEEALAACGLADRFPAYSSRHDAVMGHRPAKPR